MARLTFEALRDLHDFANNLLCSTTTQQPLLHHHHEKMIDDLSEASLLMLDACGTSKDILLHMKENLQDLMFSLRRSPSGEQGHENPISSYNQRRKKLKKAALKCLHSLKGMKSKYTCADLSPSNYNLKIVVEMLREVRSTMIAVVESLSSLACSPLPEEKQSKGFIGTKFVFSGGQNLRQLQDPTMLESTSKRLERVQTAIEDLEAELDCIFRRLIQTRVSLLNMLTF